MTENCTIAGDSTVLPAGAPGGGGPGAGIPAPNALDLPEFGT